MYHWHSFSPLLSETGRAKKTKKLPKLDFENHLSQKHKQGEEWNPEQNGVIVLPSKT